MAGQVKRNPRLVPFMERHASETYGRQLAFEIAAELRALIIREDHIVTGATLASVSVRQGSGNTWGVGYREAAVFLEDGTKPHFIPHGLGIDPGVNHPGTKAYKLLKRATETVCARKGLS